MNNYIEKKKEQIVDKLKSKSFIYHSRAKDVSSKYEEYYRGVTDGVLAAINIIDGDREWSKIKCNFKITSFWKFIDGGTYFYV